MEKEDLKNDLKEDLKDAPEVDSGCETVVENTIEDDNELETALKERDEFKDKWLRTLAEFDNFRKNNLKEKQDWIKYANEKIILDLCEVLDNFERALATEVDAQSFEAYKKGIDLIFQQFNNILKKNNVTKIEAQGKEFDPNLHDALSSIPSEEDENIVVAVIQNGYMIGEKVIRHSRVAVSNGIKPENKSNDNN